MPGTGTLAAEVTNISPHGFWLLLGDEELAVPYAEFPWFRSATVEQIAAVERPTEARCGSLGRVAAQSGRLSAQIAKRGLTSRLRSLCRRLKGQGLSGSALRCGRHARLRSTGGDASR